MESHFDRQIHAKPYGAPNERAVPRPRYHSFQSFLICFTFCSYLELQAKRKVVTVSTNGYGMCW